MRSLALLLMLFVALVPTAHANPPLVAVDTTPGETHQVPTGADPQANVDPRVAPAGELTLVRVGGTTVAVPLYSANPSYTVDPNVRTSPVTVPGVLVTTWTPVVVRTSHVGESYLVAAAVDGNLDGTYDEERHLYLVCYCPILPNWPYPLVWGTVFWSLPDAAVGPMTVALP